MSDVHVSPKHSTPPDLTALAASLQETAQALLALSSTGTLKESKVEPPARQNDGETRAYYFPQAAVHLEQDLLQRYRADDFQGLLNEAHTLLIGLIRIMQNVPKDARVKGYVISSLGSQLDHAAALLLRMRNVYERVVPIQG